MTKKLNIELILTLVVYLLANALFVYKYSMRVTTYPFLTVLSYLSLTIALVLLLPKLIHYIKSNTIWLALFIVVIACAMLLQFLIDPYSIRVDRWSAIHFWIEKLFNGEYPYNARTHMHGYGSPFPVWQIFHIPFYIFGNVALSTFFALILWVYSLIKTQSRQVAIYASVLLFIAPAVWYEVVVRSDLLANFLIVSAICNYLIYKKIDILSHPVAIGVLSGLLLSTRLAAVIPLAVLYGYRFIKMPFGKQCLFVFTTLLVLLATFIPFLIWNGDSLLHFIYSPIVLQTRQGSPLIMILWTILAFAWVIYFKNREHYFNFSCTILLFALFAFSCIKVLLLYPFYMIFTASAFDITYFDTYLPFAVLYISKNNNTKI